MSKRLRWRGMSICWVSLSLMTFWLVACDDASVSNNSSAPVVQPASIVATAASSLIQVATIQNQLNSAWQNYKSRFIQADGRVIDFSQNDVTTSEGQSYALLRAVWENDADRFKQVLSWTQNNLQTRTTDKLFAYKWGKTEDGNWRVLDNQNATDADSDIGLALLFAAKVWHNDEYQKQAQVVISDLWQHNVVTIKDKPYLTAGAWAVGEDHPALNPSYYAPYAYRIFAQVDPTHNWLGLVDSSYSVIADCSSAQLDAKTASANLPPDFCGIDRQTGEITLPQDATLNTNYSYDAFRTMWRLALDYKWNNEPRAKAYLESVSFLRDQWKQTGRLMAGYSHSGTVVQNWEDLAIYGGTLGNFLITEPALADQVVQTKLLPAYQTVRDNDPTHTFIGWGDSDNYYNQNWVWFGLALYSNKLPNLYQ